MVRSRKHQLHDVASACAQVLPLRDMALIAPSLDADGSLYVAAMGEAGIRRLIPTPFSPQSQALADALDFPEALSIAALMPSEQVLLLPWRLCAL